MEGRSRFRLLVKGGTPPQKFNVSPASVGIVKSSTPLFPHIEAGALGAAASTAWQTLEIEAPAGINAWDACHALVRDGMGAAPNGVFAEPDLQQQWIYGNEHQQALQLAKGCESRPQDNAFPTDPNNFWYRDAAHADFAANENDGAGVTVAHFDTGYDPDHQTRPRNVQHTLERNYVDAAYPNDARDRTTGGFANLGHGTGTLSILAGSGINGGAPVGGAPGAAIIPVRVANSVILFWNSAIAKAFDYIFGLNHDRAANVQIITMSMGGLASRAWADAVNALYDQGVFIVTASGDNFGNLPTANCVYPARFNRVVAACGVMANHKPYADLGLTRMAGNYGPLSKMNAAVSAYTPNVPWAKIDCEDVLNYDGSGTSAATPQVAAAAALWFARHAKECEAYPEPWMRVEAARAALFCTAQANDDRLHFGCGFLRARAAASFPEVPSGELKKEPVDTASFPLLRVLTGLGIAAEPDARQAMLELEALQLSQSATIEKILGDSESLPADRLSQLATALACDPRASNELRQALATSRRDAVPLIDALKTDNPMQKLHLRQALNPRVLEPDKRSLHVYAYDPSLEARLETLNINQATLDVRWEALEPGPVGDYLEVVDVDPPSESCYAPIDLDHRNLLASNGRWPSESNAQFHQQMVYAVAMKTIEHFERALGRVALWSPRIVRNGSIEERYVPRLRMYPHAMRVANAYYSPEKKAILFGYFPTPEGNVGINTPGALVFSCLSYDIIAHETTHALLDGLHRRFLEPTNLDVLAFHEAFADIVALFQHFTLTEALRDQIARTRGDLSQNNLLAQLAVQFGSATAGGYGALRDYIGTFDPITHRWKPTKPDRDQYAKTTEPHARGAVLVAAVFDAFLQVYRMQSAQLVRLATGGTGILPEGEIPALLVESLAQLASKLASHWLRICIRALDYCPVVDIRFGDYLRALITADRDLVPDDAKSYRVAFVSAFRERGIYAESVRHLSVSSLVWEPPPEPLEHIEHVLDKMNLSWDLTSNRESAYRSSLENAKIMHAFLMDPDEVNDNEIFILGLERHPVEDYRIGDVAGTLAPIEVHSVRPAQRVGPDGQTGSDLVVEITQTWRSRLGPPMRFRAGVTLLIDLKGRKVRYLVRKRLGNLDRYNEQLAFSETVHGNSLRANYQREVHNEPFAMLHGLN